MKRFLLLLPLSLLIGCSSETASTEPTKGESKSNPAKDLLVATFKKYQGFKSFQGTWDWRMTDGATTRKMTREISLLGPNKYRLVVTADGEKSVTAISNGTRNLILNDKLTESTIAPDSFADALNYEFMQSPVLAGTPILWFLAGIEAIVDGKTEPSLLPEKSFNGDPCKVVKFFSSGPFGTTEIAISNKTGLITHLSAKMEPIRKDVAGVFKHEDELRMEEDFNTTKINAELPASQFDGVIPAGAVVRQGTNPSSALKIGKSAPDIEVTSLDGKKTRLSSLKGRVVLIDFWATWCGPCRETLPATQGIYKATDRKDLIVLPITDETADKIRPFAKEAKLDLPWQMDPQQDAMRSYGAKSLPTFVVINKEGKIAAYVVGGGQEMVIGQALEAAGVKPKR